MPPVVSPSLPVSSGEMPAIDLDRLEEVQAKHARLAEYLNLNQIDGILIRQPCNYAWFTAGASCHRGFAGEPIAAILVTEDARVLLCNNIDSGQIFDRELSGLGFLLKERSWTEDRRILLKDVCRGRKIVTDTFDNDLQLPNIADDLTPMRFELVESELSRLRELGLAVVHAVEATGRTFSNGISEAEVAAYVAHRLIKKEIEPVQIQVMADGQGWRYRHWNFGSERVERHCVISCVARKHGLHIATSRTICFGDAPNELRQVHELATLVQATGLYFSRPDWAYHKTWERVQRIYEKFEIPDEWRSAEQAKIMGYRPVEFNLTPDSDRILQNGHVIHWHPSVRASHVGDSFLISEAGIENLTPVESWPLLTVDVKGTQLDRPGILIR